MAQQLIKNDTNVLTASVFLRCTNAVHVDCIGLLGSVKGLPNVTYAETTNTKISNEEYCVHGMALVKPNEFKKFEKKLESLGAEKVHIFISK